MIAEILSVGTELLMGQIANTAAQYISRRLSELGVTLYRHTTVAVSYTHLSVSRLESFAACPFAHFLRYGLKPEIVEPYALTPRDEGVFFHAAVRGFLDEAMADGDFDPDRADARMERRCV